MTARAARLIERLGARYDLTVEPGALAVHSLHPGLDATGHTADMRSAPREPYRPSPDDPMRAGDGSLWMIPLTSMDPDPILPAWRRIARCVRHPGGPWHRPTTLTAAWPADAFWPMVERELAAMSRPYLAFAIRSDAPLIPHVIDSIDAKLAALLAARLEFTTPDVASRTPRAALASPAHEAHRRSAPRPPDRARPPQDPARRRATQRRRAVADRPWWTGRGGPA